MSGKDLTSKHGISNCPDIGPAWAYVHIISLPWGEVETVQDCVWKGRGCSATLHVCGPRAAWDEAAAQTGLMKAQIVGFYSLLTARGECNGQNSATLPKRWRVKHLGINCWCKACYYNITPPQSVPFIQAIACCKPNYPQEIASQIGYFQSHCPHK